MEAAILRRCVVVPRSRCGREPNLLSHLFEPRLDFFAALAQVFYDLLDAEDDDGCSLVRAVGPDAARARAAALLDGALHLIEDWGERAEPLRECARFAARRSR